MPPNRFSLAECVVPVTVSPVCSPVTFAAPSGSGWAGSHPEGYAVSVVLLRRPCEPFGCESTCERAPFGGADLRTLTVLRWERPTLNVYRPTDARQERHRPLLRCENHACFVLIRRLLGACSRRNTHCSVFVSVPCVPPERCEQRSGAVSPRVAPCAQEELCGITLSDARSH